MTHTNLAKVFFTFRESRILSRRKKGFASTKYQKLSQNLVILGQPACTNTQNDFDINIMHLLYDIWVDAKYICKYYILLDVLVLNRQTLSTFSIYIILKLFMRTNRQISYIAFAQNEGIYSVDFFV